MPPARPTIHHPAPLPPTPLDAQTELRVCRVQLLQRVSDEDTDLRLLVLLLLVACVGLTLWR